MAGNKRDFRVKEIDLTGIARGLYEMIMAGQNSQATKAFLRQALPKFFRDWNQYPDYVSVKAKLKADELGIKYDLRKIQYPQYLKIKEHFHWEHMAPAQQVANEILDMPEPTVEKIEAKLRTIVVCLIDKSEDAPLPRSNRPDPTKAYADARIELFQYDDGA
jgi:hypothetical protein